MKTCDLDSQCPNTEKCCPGSCGNICRPVDIPQSITDLPPIPSNITHQEKHKGTSVLIHWQGPAESSDIFYVVQERHHIGVHYREEKLGDWCSGFVVEKPRLKKKYVFVPGRWYQVRVAAVNLYGTRGFSPPSETFKLSVQPKPPGAPLNLNFEAVHLVNDKFWIELHWDPPVSELPISKYVIYWSTLATFELKGSPYVKFQETISPEQTHFSIPELDRNKRVIMFEVQAMSMFGSRRLKGEKANIHINTPEYANAETLDLDLSNISKGNRKKRLRKKKKLSDFKVERIFNQNEELFAKLSWGGVGVNVTDHYTITWSSNQCANVTRSVFTASTDNNWYTIHGLNYNCKYRTSVKTHHHRLLFSSSLRDRQTSLRTKEIFVTLRKNLIMGKNVLLCMCRYLPINMIARNDQSKSFFFSLGG
uniref:Anosmin-1 n=1 Tax=Cacopsylla melanoneura TaxID=428564 RepID=A0A8D9DWW6_9HEMI